MEDITAYHHTKTRSASIIMQNGFDSKCFRKVTLGFGVQCFLESQEYSPYKGKTDGQLKVFFEDCNVLRVQKLIEESLSLIRDAEDWNQRVQFAMNEATRLIGLGYDAYTVKAVNGRDAIVFLNFPTPLLWLPYVE